ncbi:MAG: NAD(P)H-dependent oxidoreductase [Meiothermus sp.]|nr:NAD(P)H-dependent oxidoreductase [Meiothermus sp.]
MNILIVYAHPNPNSFNAAMREVAVGALSRAGHSILTSDLYAMHFNPVLSARELAGDHHALKAEMSKVHRADMLLFQFPDWWYGMPAIMKGWVDRVFAQGFAYDEGQEFEKGLLRGKKAMISMTVGYPKSYYAQAPQRDLMRVLEPIHYGYFAYCGLEVLPPYVVYAPGGMSDAERRDVLEDYRLYLMELHKVKPLVF